MAAARNRGERDLCRVLRGFVVADADVDDPFVAAVLLSDPDRIELAETRRFGPLSRAYSKVSRRVAETPVRRCICKVWPPFENSVPALLSGIGRLRIHGFRVEGPCIICHVLDERLRNTNLQP